jgi:hypothetical protein
VVGDAARRPLTVAVAFTLTAAILVLGPAPPVPAASQHTLTDFSVLGLDGVELKNGATIVSGHLGANNAGAGVTIKSKAVVLPSSLVVGDTVSLGKNSVVTDVAANDLVGKGVPTGVVTSPVALPLVDDVPATPTFTPGTENLAVKKGEAITIEPGGYGTLTTKKEAVLIFTGGDYHFASWDVAKDATLSFQGLIRQHRHGLDLPVAVRGTGAGRRIRVPMGCASGRWLCQGIRGGCCRHGRWSCWA